MLMHTLITRMMTWLLLLFCLQPIASFAQNTMTNYNDNETPDYPELSEPGIPVSPGENREYAFTDKRNGYYYGRTHTYNPDWFSGWNVARARIFKDYHLFLGGDKLDREKTSAVVYPHKMVRRFNRTTETLRLFDNKPLIEITLDTKQQNPVIGIQLDTTLLSFDTLKDGQYAVYKPEEAPEKRLVLAPRNPHSNLENQNSRENPEWHSQKDADGFFIALDSTETGATQLIEEARNKHEEWTRARNNRMNRLLENNRFASGSKQLNRAVSWNILSLDALIMKQTGYGIYAGLPWFNDYWGRDLFISFPGAVLVTGQHDVAADILRSFAKYQNKDIDSKNFGRMPNRLRPDEIIYNTTDGTPRFVIALYQYWQYTGDTSLIEELYPAVRRSIEGPMSYWVNDEGYLTHEDADTWMDAKIDNRIPYSPRGNRANDIQALWYKQLKYGSKMADLTGNDKNAQKWRDVAEKVQANFKRDFLDEEHSYMADRLTKSDSADYKLRPNQLFALDMIEDESTRWNITKQVWQHLVYPWGVASLDQRDSLFHPYHDDYPGWHKDQAYHNGTVWIWNNGIAMQRMLEAEQVSQAYRLFDNMNHQTLNRGAAGCLAENADAHPRDGKEWARLSGTFSQAWSSAEYLRVWYQYFVGIRPKLNQNLLVLQPRLPETMDSLKSQTALAGGRLSFSMQRLNESTTRYRYTFNGTETGELTIRFKLPLFEAIETQVGDGETLLFQVEEESLHLKRYGKDGDKLLTDLTVYPDPEALGRLRKLGQTFQDVDFAEPQPVSEEHLERLENLDFGKKYGP